MVLSKLDAGYRKVAVVFELIPENDRDGGEIIAYRLFGFEK